MSPLDSIGPPKKKKKAKPPTPVTDTRKKNSEKKSLPHSSIDNENKKRLLWILVSATTIVIIIGWFLLLQGGLLTESQSKSRIIDEIGNKLANLWGTIKTDILKLQQAAENSNTNNANEEQIKELEGQVFPQFTDPTKQ